MNIINRAVSEDASLRTELHIGDKFRFIRDGVSKLKHDIENALTTINVDTQEDKEVLASDEQLVYVYLFNAHGIDLRTWVRMLHASVFYEHSVNRPIYGEKEHIEALIRSKTNRIQHGYLTVAVKRDLIINKGDYATLDSIGNPVLKIKEASLKPERLMRFTHNGNDYVLDEDGRLEKL